MQYKIHCKLKNIKQIFSISELMANTIFTPYLKVN